MDGRNPYMSEEHAWYLFQREHSHWYKKVEFPRRADPKAVVMGPQLYHKEAMLKAKGARMQEGSGGCCGRCCPS